MPILEPHDPAGVYVDMRYEKYPKRILMITFTIFPLALNEASLFEGAPRPGGQEAMGASYDNKPQPLRL